MSFPSETSRAASDRGHLRERVRWRVVVVAAAVRLDDEDDDVGDEDCGERMVPNAEEEAHCSDDERCYCTVLLVEAVGRNGGDALVDHHSFPLDAVVVVVVAPRASDMVVDLRVDHCYH
jgi:hypothetical protein